MVDDHRQHRQPAQQVDAKVPPLLALVGPAPRQAAPNVDTRHRERHVHRPG